MHNKKKQMHNKKKQLLEEIEPLYESIENLKGGNFLQPTNTLFSSVLRNCIELLKKHDYIIKQIPKNTKSIDNISDLVNHYYNVLRWRKNDSIIPFRSFGPDMAIAKALIKKIQDDLGYDYKESINFAVKMIERLFDLEEKLNINTHVLVGFRSVFGQDKMGWITEQIINSINNDLNDPEVLVMSADKEAEEYAKENDIKYGWEDLEELTNKLE